MLWASSVEPDSSRIMIIHRLFHESESQLRMGDFQGMQELSVDERTLGISFNRDYDAPGWLGRMDVFVSGKFIHSVQKPYSI